MRIISGEFRFRKLTAPRDKSVRPTGDKVKGAMFSIVQYKLPGAVVCDLFAGTGNLGLEALSRGASKCWFGDSSAQSIKMIKENISHCGADERSVTVPGEFTKTLDRIDSKVDIFLLDPPYGKGLIERAVSMISEMDLLNEDGIIIAEHDKRDEIPEVIGRYKKIKEKKYGTVVLSIFVC